MRNIVGTQWKEKMELVGKLLLLLNSYNSTLHVKTTHEQAAAQSHPQLGPYFPRRKQPINNSQQQQQQQGNFNE
ncbi:unnamed protein product [Rotaria sp. Silwood2]|nr:unnamed protein product [Rotaria sp. Silwood2]CAF3868714.1 unnamed protein product [Rotaria sp. Silwood2]